MLSIINNNRDALLSISGTRLWSGQNAQGYNCTCIGIDLTSFGTKFTEPTANAIAWGALAPQMFGPKSTYRMVPISLAIGLVLPLPFWVAVRSGLNIEQLRLLIR